MNKRCLLLVILLVLLPPVLAEFTIDAIPQTIESCPTNINLFTIPVTNIGSEAGIYTVSLSGSAAKWAVAAPPGFVLSPGNTQTVFVYATPAKNTPIGEYTLNININDGKESKALKETVIVKECFGARLSTAQEEKKICSCQETDFLFTLENTGEFTENYKVSLAGSASIWATLSQQFIRLLPGESEDITIHVAPGCEKTGVFGLTLTAKAERSEAIASSSTGLVIDGCYNFGLYPEKNYYSFCENSELKAVITLENEGSSEDTYSLSTVGVSWISLDKKEIKIPGNGGASVNLMAFPAYGIIGNYPVKINAESERGGQKKSTDLNLNVLSCYSTSLSLEKESDSLCPGTESRSNLVLTNAGNFDETYGLTLSGADWASLSASSVVLGASESKEIELILSPGIDVSSGNYNVMVTSKAQGTSGVSSDVSLNVDILSKEDCFAVNIKPQIGSTEVEIGGSSLIPVTVENSGIKKTKYTLDISGNGASYAQLNPSALEVEGGESEETYLYISAPDRTETGTYNLVVSVRDEQGVVSSSSAISFKVVEKVEDDIPITGVASGWTAGLSDIGAGLREGLGEVPYVAEGYDYLKEHWYLGIAIIILIVLAIAFVIGKLTGMEEGDEFIDDFYEKPKKEKKEGLWKRFTSWLEAEDMEEFEVGWEKKPKKEPAKKEKGLWGKFNSWLEEEEPVKKAPPKKKEKGAWDNFLSWLEEEEPKKAAPKKKNKKGAWDKFMDWLEED